MDNGRKVCTVNGHAAWLRAQLKSQGWDDVEYVEEPVAEPARGPDEADGLVEPEGSIDRDRHWRFRGSQKNFTAGGK